MLVRLRPDAEFLEIVAHRRKAARMPARGAAQEFGGLAHVGEGNQVSQSLQPGKNFHGVAKILGDVVAEKLFELEAGAEKMVVVDQCVVDARGRKARGELRLPHALGKPCAARSGFEMFLGVCGQPRDLLEPIVRRNRNKDRFVKSAAYDFHLAT